MSTDAVLSGACLCGAVKFSFHAEDHGVGVCHCSMCRRWSGGPFLAMEGGKDLKIENEGYLGVYKSSEWGERCFCNTCGSVLFWRAQDGSVVAVSAGALDSSEGLKLTREIFIDEKPSYYDFANETERLTGAEFVEMVFGGGTND